MLEKIVVLGAGESGVGAALLAQAKGKTVFVSDFGQIQDVYQQELDENGIRFEQGQHTEEEVLSASEIVKSPGIPDTAPIVQKAREKGINVVSEIEFASRYTDAKFVCITGSNGKTTTTLLAYHLIESAGFHVGLAGNIGTSLAKQVIEDDFDYVVVELSSFQLDGMYDFKAHIAVLLNITPDHLDRYDYDFQKYVDSKFRITRNQTFDDYLITFVDDEVIREELSKRNTKGFNLAVSLKDRMLNGSYVSNDRLMFNIHNHITRVFNIDVAELPLSGRHNQINIMSAVMAALAAGVPENVIKRSLSRFENVEHRLEDIGEVNGLKFINDSKATNVDAVKYALDSFDDPIIWVAGGVDKGNDYKEIQELVYEKVKAIVCIGTDNQKIIEFFGEEVPMILEVSSMEEAVSMSHEMGTEGDVVLLSPACASFDRFNNYEDRGHKFKEAVNASGKGVSEINFLSL